MTSCTWIRLNNCLLLCHSLMGSKELQNLIQCFQYFQNLLSANISSVSSINLGALSFVKADRSEYSVCAGTGPVDKTAVISWLPLLCHAYKMALQSTFPNISPSAPSLELFPYVRDDGINALFRAKLCTILFCLHFVEPYVSDKPCIHWNENPSK